MDLTNTQEIILRLKAIKKEKDLTLSRIMDLLEANGDYLSMTTLRRVFAANSEQDDSFSYDKTIRPIARALLFHEGQSPEDTHISAEKLEGLKAIIWLKNEEIDRLEKQIEAIRAEYENRIAFLRGQIDKKDKRMDEKDMIINRLMEKIL